MKESHYIYHPAQSSASSPRRKSSHPFEDLIVGNWEHHAADFKHDMEDCCSNEISKQEASCSSTFDASAFMVPRRLFSSSQTDQNNPLVQFLAAEQRHVPSFHPIADADAIPIDLNRGISDHLLMDPFYWGNHHPGAFCDPTPMPMPTIQEMLILPQDQEEQLLDEIDPLLLVSTFLPEDHPHPVSSSTRRVKVLKRKCDEEGYGAPEQQSDTEEEEKITTILQFSPVTPSPNKKPKLICPSPVESIMLEQSDAIHLLPTKKTNTNETFDTRKLSVDSASSDQKVASSSEATTVAALKKKKGVTTQKNRFRQYHAANWTDHLEEAAEYQKKNGHCAIPHNYPPNQQLARWAKRQRYQYKLCKYGKPSSMTQERVQALEKLDFCWNAHKENWYARYEELKQFKMDLGHSNVPSNYEVNRKLATWVKCQRRQYKLSHMGEHSNITPDRIELLEKLDFVWDCIREMTKEGEK